MMKANVIHIQKILRTMEKKKAVKKIKRIRLLFKIFRKMKTTASIRYVDTSYGKVRVLEYGIGGESGPLHVDVHGGGYCLGAPEMDEEANLRIRESTGVKIISIDYPKAPENPYPTGLEAAYEVIKHYHDNAAEYGIDTGRMGIGGYSSGGNFATTIPMKAKERGDFGFRYQMMCYPGTDISMSPHLKQGSEKVLKKKLLEMIHHCYISEPEHAFEPYASPRLAPKEMLTGLPPALLILAGVDPLLQEGKDYGDHLRDAGVDTEVHVFENADHGFTYMGKGADKEEAFSLIVDFIKKHMSQ